MTKRYILSLILISISILVYGQGEMDLRYMSLTDLQGTARGQAMGGAFGALGGDMTGTMINPAGVAVYRSSEISGTLDVGNVKNDANWQGIKESESRWKVALNNLSLVYYSPMGKETLKNINFGFSYHRLKSVNNKYTARGERMPLSLLDYIANITNGIESNKVEYYGHAPLLSELAWDGWLIDLVEGSNDTYWPSELKEGEVVDPELYVEESGYLDAYDFTLGFNFNHRWYWGATFTITDIDYSRSTFYTETFEFHLEGTSEKPYFNLDNNLISKGSGYQLKTGLIWRPIDALRLGVSYHSPTWFYMTDYYSASLNSNFGKDVNDTNNGDKYEFQSPYSWTFSLAGIIGTKAILSLDYEIKDYTTMNLKDNNGENVKDLNEIIDEDFKVASTIRLGAEYKVTPQLALRAGYVWSGSPYTANLKDDLLPPSLYGGIPSYTVDGATQYITGGIGYRFTQNFYLDLAFVHRRQSSDLYFFPSLYNTIEEDENTIRFEKYGESVPSTLKTVANKALLTLGYRF